VLYQSFSYLQKFTSTAYAEATQIQNSENLTIYCNKVSAGSTSSMYLLSLQPTQIKFHKVLSKKIVISLIGAVNYALLLLAGLPQILQADAQEVWIMTAAFIEPCKKCIAQEICNVQNVKENNPMLSSWINLSYMLM
jgi:hypothetical protein